MKYAIKHRYTDVVLYEADIPADTPSGMQCRAALEKATQAKVNLSYSDLSGSDLSGSDLSYSDLSGAIVRHQKLIGARPFFHIGPIGSRCAQFVSYITEAGLLLNAGCFWGTVDEFRAKLADEHGDNDHAKEYEMALLMIEAHAAIWTPKEEA